MSLTNEDIAIAKGMLQRGDRQQDIAAYLSCNSGRIAEISTGARCPDVQPHSDSDLPPPGPYFLNMRAKRDIIIVALENAFEPMALYFDRLQRDRPRDEDAIMEAQQALASVRTALAERKRENHARRDNGHG